MLRLILPLTFCSLILALTLACGGGGNGSSTTVSGTIDDSSLDSSSKALLAASDALTATATNVDDTTQTFTITVDGRKYSGSITPGINVNIEIKNGDTVILSRVLDKDQTTSNVTAEINVVTHVQAKLAVENVKTGKTLAEALKSANQELFGSETVNESGLKVSTALKVIEGRNASFAAQIATMGQLVASFNPNSTDIKSTFSSLNGSFEHPTVAGVATAFTQRVNNFSSSTAAVFASAFEGAKNANILVAPTASFTAFQSTLTASIVTSAISSALRPPIFGTAGTPKTAAPGIVFSFTIPPATTEDVLGISRYSGSFTTAPDGNWNLVGRTLNFVPSQSDINKTFTYTFVAHNANGKTVSKAISIPVKGMKITKNTRMKLLGSVNTANSGTYYPILGPVLAGDYFYLVARFSASGHRLEKYATSGINRPSTSDLSLASSWVLPTGNTPKDLAVGNNVAFLAYSNTSVGLIGYKTNATSSTPDYQSKTMSGTELALHGSRIYNMTSQIVMSNDLLLSSTPKTESTLTDKVKSISANDIGSFSDYLYVASNSTATFYNMSSGSPVALATDFTPQYTGFDILNNDYSRHAGSPLYAVSTMTSTKLTPGSDLSSAVALSFSSALDSKLSVRASNGTMGYTANASTGVWGFSLRTTNFSTAATDSTANNFSYKYTGELNSMIINRPEGISNGKSGAYLYMPGQYTASVITENTPVHKTMTGSWYIKAFDLEPVD